MLRSAMLSLAIYLALVSTTTASLLSINETTVPQAICGSTLSADRISQAEKDFQEKIAANKDKQTALDSLKSNIVTIPVYVSVVYADTSPQGGYVSDSQVNQQIAEVNRGFQGTGFQFQLMDIDRFQNPYWFNNADPATDQPQYDMKKRLRYGAAGPRALNVYIVGLNNVQQQGLLGYSTFPVDYNSRDPVYDGIMLRYSTLPGGSSQGNSLGKTLTHEVGHWVGLYHPFETFQQYANGCYGPGDYVDDTPAEASPAFGCPTGQDTCPGGGPDPIHNYMDYTTDSCRTEFTPGQIQRLQQQVYYYRGLRP